MGKMNRREFLKAGLAGVAGLSLGGKALANMRPDEWHSVNGVFLDKVKLGNTGLVVPRLAMGTGTVGTNKSSNQTRKGMDFFVKMALHAYERGMRYYDMADMYGSHQYVAQALKKVPRENVILQSKLWTYADGTDRVQPVREDIDRFRLEIGTDYIDILLMHCIMDGKWPQNRTHYMEGFARAKEDGIVKTIGLSCHSLDALAAAVDNPWVDVILARLNPFQTIMDGTPEVVNELLGKAKANGKGIIGMKIFGEGKHITATEREQSLAYAVKQSNLDCMTVGMESEAQIDDAVNRVMRLVKS